MDRAAFSSLDRLHKALRRSNGLQESLHTDHTAICRQNMWYSLFWFGGSSSPLPLPSMAPSPPVPGFPSSDLSNREASPRRQNRSPPYKFSVPLIYAPILPLIRIGLRRNLVVRDRLFYGVLASAFAHGVYLVTDVYDIESK